MSEHDQTQSRTERQHDAFMFMSLVTTYQQMAWIAMGKIANPATNAVERDLDQARWAIDVMGMLERRTRGNLSDGETRMLREAVHVLRMNYVEEANRPPEPAPKEPKPPDIHEGPAAGESEPGAAKGDPGKGPEPRAGESA